MLLDLGDCGKNIEGGSNRKRQPKIVDEGFTVIVWMGTDVRVEISARTGHAKTGRSVKY